MEYEIKSGATPTPNPRTGQYSAVLAAVRKLKPGEWFAIPASELEGRKRTNIQGRIHLIGKMGGIVIKTKTADDKSLIVYRPEQP